MNDTIEILAEEIQTDEKLVAEIKASANAPSEEMTSDAFKAWLDQ